MIEYYMIKDKNHSSFIPLSRRPDPDQSIINQVSTYIEEHRTHFQAATRRMGVWVRSIHLRYTLFTTQGVQLSGKVPYVIFEWLVQDLGGSPKV